jgi:hypothetical protein
MEKIIFSKKGQRQLTDFLAGEMLYDYATEQLDPDRKEAMQKAILQNPNLGKELEDILYGIKYCKLIAQTQIKSTLIQKMKQPFSLWRGLEKLLNIRTWNPGFQWLGEALVISICLLLISFFVPWESLVFNFIAKNNEKVLLSSTRPKNLDLKLNETESDRFSNKTPTTTGTSSKTSDFKPVILRKYILRVANPVFTYSKLPILVQKHSASIDDQILVPVGQDNIPQITFSFSQDRAEALIKELESHGKLTLAHSSGENEKERQIWTFQIELEKEVK